MRMHTYIHTDYRETVHQVTTAGSLARQSKMRQYLASTLEKLEGKGFASD